MNKNAKGNLYNEQLRNIKSILSKENRRAILIISWEKNILGEDGGLYYKALIYDPLSGEKKLFRTTERNPETIIIPEDNSDVNFKELIYILDNYINGNEEYLLSLKDSFNSAEIGYPYYIYDFAKDKKIKIKSFVFDKNGKLIQ
ncbi:hypothetical protein FW781_04050 (plasmid) [Chryseobacterium panacisoli]|uniref:Uncharacterized protein n=1 Tax=Chryseobacterium panacisoli TaxID=1807141 RepID=A0A5D8ZW09_9FLAO|nr:hypothetical protein [Chryseobacterium panacisoli]TZF99108.1 hypothetical protein FW781_04050 [Chryseobacterium panacisoli]